MATFDQPSELVYRIAYPSVRRLGLRTDPRIASLPAQGEKQLPVPSSQQGIEEGSLFREIESGAKLKRNPWAGAGALALQGLILLAVVVVPLFHTDPLPKRETLTMLYLQPPPARGRQCHEASSTHTSVSVDIEPRQAPAFPLQYIKPKKRHHHRSAQRARSSGEFLAEWSAEFPVERLSEALSSTRSAPVPVKTFDPPPVKRIRVASRVVEANLIHDVPPQYPPEAGRARIEGTVVLLAVIGTDGSVKDVRVENGLPILAQAAIDAVKQWRYKPYMVDGEPVEVDSRITINFTLSGA